MFLLVILLLQPHHLRSFLQALPNGGRGIDTSRLEMYLSDEEFEKLLGVTKTQWEDGTVKDWKKRDLKAKFKLY